MDIRSRGRIVGGVVMAHVSRRTFLEHGGALAGVGVAVSSGRSAAEGVAEVDPGLFSTLRTRLTGRLVLADDQDYATAKRVFYWNPRIEQRPVAIVECGEEEDAVRAVDFARSQDLEIAVRSGGHSHLAWSSCNGVVIDLSKLKKMTVDPARRIVHAEGGVFSGEVARVAGRYGLAPVLGQCPGVSATGVTLGGGLGWLAGLYGASCDNLMSARLVTADGQWHDVNDQTNPELFWGLRGAGANFGVTTSFTARLHEVGTILGGDFHYSPSDAKAVLQGFREVMHAAPDTFQATLNLTRGERGLFLSFCHAGAEIDADAMLQSLRAIAKPTKEIVLRQPFAKLAEKAAATNPGKGAVPAFREVQTVRRERITDDVIEILVDQLAQATPDVVMGLSHYMHGEVCRVLPDATAFPHRQEHSLYLRMAHSWSDARLTDDRFAWSEQWRERLRPRQNERIYANYQTYETKQGSPSVFAENHARLLTLKQRYDPENVFHRNANIAPARG
jgi:FAD/FMN-containing dehydrogenase